MATIQRIQNGLKALLELGPLSLVLYARYQLGLRSGYTRWLTKAAGREVLSAHPDAFRLHRILTPPEREPLAAVLSPTGQERLLAEASEVAAGMFRPFGGPPAPLELAPRGPLRHWTAYERGEAPGGRGGNTAGEDGDIKFIWEPGRFGWAFPLGRAYQLTGDEGCAAAFWRWTEVFWASNTPYLGPQWASAQEVALRLIALAWAVPAFAGSPHSTPERMEQLGRAAAAHAARLPLTLTYARAQNNNHLLSEAAGLYTAGLLLPDHPQAKHWRSAGWRLFHRGLADQIASDGTYIQHSANYHRLMLQLALWVNALAQRAGQTFPPASREKLAAATSWLLALLDPHSGRVPNLGPNDGANLLPLAALPFEDYRPTLQAAAAAFLGKTPCPAGPWDELSLWVGEKQGIGGRGIGEEVSSLSPIPYPLPSSPLTLHSPTSRSWAYLRVARFSGRPGHADQLHLDLWWRGLNVAQDAGTYRYTAPPPWENALAATAVHNTLSVEGRDQMTRAGRFLFLDWAQGQVVSGERDPTGGWKRLAARHDGYRALGLLHQREVETRPDRWVVIDSLLSYPGSAERTPARLHRTARLHWLLPDWPFELAQVGDDGLELVMQSPLGPVSLRVYRRRKPSTPAAPGAHEAMVEGTFLAGTLVRAGELLRGPGPASPILGWVSPTYGVKLPALSFSVSLAGPLPLQIESQWIFPD